MRLVSILDLVLGSGALETSSGHIAPSRHLSVEDAHISQGRQCLQGGRRGALAPFRLRCGFGLGRSEVLAPAILVDRVFVYPDAAFSGPVAFEFAGMNQLANLGLVHVQDLRHFRHAQAAPQPYQSIGIARVGNEAEVRERAVQGLLPCYGQEQAADRGQDTAPRP